MAIASFLLGLLALLGVCVALVPLLNVVNCVMLPLGLFGLIMGVADLLRHRENGEGRRGLAVAGVVLSGLALLVGGARMILSLLAGGGIL